MKILLADDHQLIRDGLRTMLCTMLTQPPVILEANGFEQARAQLMRHPDTTLAIVDMRMSDAEDAARLTNLVCQFPSIPLIVLSGFLQAHCVRELLRLPSVYGIVSKCGDPDTLQFVVLEALAGRRVGDAHNFVKNIQPTALPAQNEELPKRLQEVYDLLREGKSNKAIAWELKLSEGTVKNYVSLIYKQLNVHNRIEAAWKQAQ